MTPIQAMFVQATLMVLLPLFLWGWSARRFGLGRHGWAVIGYGCLFFILSQILNTPLRLAAVFLGAAAGPTQVIAFSLIAGVGEELARYVAMRHVGQIRERLDRASAIVYGLGHGGFESLALGLVVLATAFLVRNIADPATALDASAALIAQAEVIQQTPPYVFLAGALERAIAIVLHVGLSLIVARAILARQPRLLVLAILVHAGANAGGLALQQAVGNVWMTEAWVVLVAAGALYYGVTARDLSERAGAEEPSGSGAVDGAAGRS